MHPKVRFSLLLAAVAVIIGLGIVAMAPSGAKRLPKAQAVASPAKPTEQRRDSADSVSMNGQLPVESTEVVAHGTVYERLYIDLSDDDLDTIKREAPRFLNRITLLGWVREGNRFYRMVPARDVRLRFGNEVIDVRNGSYALVAQESAAPGERRELKRALTERRAATSSVGGYAALPFEVSLQNVPIPGEHLQILSEDVGRDPMDPVRLDIVENVDFRELKAQMHHDHASTAQSASAPMERCMDYNGPMSNGGNYGVNDPRAWVNFVCSDCDLAGAGRCVSCWTDHFVGGCQLHHGKVCSYYIGHSSSYHKHSWSQCKYCI